MASTWRRRRVRVRPGSGLRSPRCPGAQLGGRVLGDLVRQLRFGAGPGVGTQPLGRPRSESRREATVRGSDPSIGHVTIRSLGARLVGTVQERDLRHGLPPVTGRGRTGFPISRTRRAKPGDEWSRRRDILFRCARRRTVQLDVNCPAGLRTASAHRHIHPSQQRRRVTTLPTARCAHDETGSPYPLEQADQTSQTPLGPLVPPVGHPYRHRPPLQAPPEVAVPSLRCVSRCGACHRGGRNIPATSRIEVDVKRIGFLSFGHYQQVSGEAAGIAYGT